MLDLYLAESINKDTYEEKFNAINKRIAHNLTVIESEQRTISQSPTISIDYLKERQKAYPTASKEDKRRLLLQLIKQIVVDGDKITINWWIK